MDICHSRKKLFLMFSLVLFLLLGGLISSGSADSLDNWYWINPPTNYTLNAVAYGNGTFVAVGDSNTKAGHITILTSPDGVNWTEKAKDLGLIEEELGDVAYGNGTFVILGATDFNYPIELLPPFDPPPAFPKQKILYSVDNGETWQESILNSPDECVGDPCTALFKVTYGNDKFVAIGVTEAIYT